MSEFIDKAVAGFDAWLESRPINVDSRRAAFLAGARFALEELLRSETFTVSEAESCTYHVVEEGSINAALHSLSPKPEEATPPLDGTRASGSVSAFIPTNPSL